MDLINALEPVGGGACHDVHDAGSRPDSAQRQETGSRKFGVALQLPSGDVEQPAEIAVVRSQQEGGVHDLQVQTMVAGVDEHGTPAQRLCDAPRPGDVHFDDLDRSGRPGEQESGLIGIAVADHDVDFCRRGLDQVADDNPPHRAGAADHGDPVPNPGPPHPGISPRRCA